MGNDGFESRYLSLIMPVSVAVVPLDWWLSVTALALGHWCLPSTTTTAVSIIYITGTTMQ